MMLTHKELLDRWKHPCKILKDEEMGIFFEACQKAREMPSQEWYNWVRAAYSYSVQCKFAKQVGLCTPGGRLYDSMRAVIVEISMWEGPVDPL